MAENSITVVGNVVRTPELKTLALGNVVVKFTVASNRKVKEEERVSYFDVTAFGSLAENVAASIDKGGRVIVTGRLEQRSYEDKNGNTRSAFEIVADAVGPDLRFTSVTYSRSRRDNTVDNLITVDF